MNRLRLLAVPALALGAAALAATPAMAADGSYSSTLGQVNGTTGTGTVTVDVVGDQATVNLQVSGLAETFMEAPYPHVQHIHGNALGVCPTADADANADGIISVSESAPGYGPILATVTTSGPTSPAEALNLQLGGQGGTYSVQRTFTVDAATVSALENGTAVFNVHGLDPATTPSTPEAFSSRSDLTPEPAAALPLGATAPALCGTLIAAQMGAMPSGGAGTGAVVEQTSNDAGLMALGGGLALAAAAGGTVLVRRRIAQP